MVKLTVSATGVIELSQRIANWTVLRPDRLEKNE